MRTVLRWRWAVLAAWLVAAAVLMVTAPNMEQLVRDKGQISVPDGSPSALAGNLLKEMNGGTADEWSSALVFHNENNLTPSDKEEIKRGLQKLRDDRHAGVTNVVTHYDTPELENQLVSQDGKTVLALVSLEKHGREPAQARDALYAAVADVNVDHYYTGGWLIEEDLVESSQEGLKKTEWLTVIFIVAILFVVFRSAAAPFIPLLTVGLTYVVSQSIVAWLVRYLDFPLSTFTQIFLVAILFGIGTDYCILLISRFKEELAKRGDKADAIVETYRTAGKTVFFSGLAVLVGFASIGFSTFVLYRSAVAVAVGIAVLLVAIATLVPFFMMTMGKAIFWPSKGAMEHKENGLWGAVGRFSMKRPVLALLIVAAVAGPFLFAYKGTPSFNSMDEIGSSFKSVKAFDIISDSFGPGESLPSAVVIKADKEFDTPEGLAVIEQVSRELYQIDGVKTVRSATRPTGEALEDLQVAKQMDALGSGLGEGEDGLSKITEGLADAGKSLSDNAPELNKAADGANRLADGTAELKAGIVNLGDGLKRIETGLRDGTAGAGELKNGLAQAQSSAEQLAAASEQLLANYRQMGSGLSQLSETYGGVGTKVNELTLGLSELGKGLSTLADKYPDLGSDPDFAKAQGAVAQLQSGASELGGGIAQLNARLAGIAQGLQQANDGFARASEGQTKLAHGLGRIVTGIGQLQEGIAQAADGQGQITAQLPEVVGGIERIELGQRELGDGFTRLASRLGELTDGLNQSVDGLTQVTDGLTSAQQYLLELSSAPDKQLTGWFLPDEAARNEEFRDAVGMYVSKDGKIARFDVVFDTNPYMLESLKKVDELQAAVGRALRGSAYAQAEYAVDGVSSINNDLWSISGADYSRTVVLMMIGIGLILVAMFRSIVIPLYVMLSLWLTYYTAMAMAETLFVRILGLSSISWTVFFFGFVILIALGVDYSIFLMDRFKEERMLGAKEAILKAMRSTGSVIMSAAVILGGTFAAMIPSGVMSLMQIATVVLCGLFLYSFVMLPLFVPVMVRTFGEANWWPMRGRENQARRLKQEESAQAVCN
ncbi:MMPL/RND family transporter [Paenibacillus alkalitolerans]|uniref:MMPL/RND family transporter n=1 Tax=Paenibacillus alkalitolerans TaxID=2799335 RepID=UPI0018F5F689|nr:MMPL family transporter [Paenibacillus alkalitolerans]